MEDDNAHAAQAKRGSPFLNTDQAAYYIGIGSRTLAGLRRTGGGPKFRRHGRNIRYHVADVNAWSQANAHTIIGRPDDPSPAGLGPTAGILARG